MGGAGCSSNQAVLFFLISMHPRHLPLIEPYSEGEWRVFCWLRCRQTPFQSVAMHHTHL